MNVISSRRRISVNGRPDSSRPHRPGSPLQHSRIAELPFHAVAPDGSAILLAEWSDQEPERLTIRLFEPTGDLRASWELPAATEIGEMDVPYVVRWEIVPDGG